MAGTEGNTLVLGEPNLIVKVCVSLKRLLIVTFRRNEILLWKIKLCFKSILLPPSVEYWGAVVGGSSKSYMTNRVNKNKFKIDSNFFLDMLMSFIVHWIFRSKLKQGNVKLAWGQHNQLKLHERRIY